MATKLSASPLPNCCHPETLESGGEGKKGDRSRTRQGGGHCPEKSRALPEGTCFAAVNTELKDF